eukprot:5316212-Pleurochrysis_carterae.AAC.1
MEKVLCCQRHDSDGTPEKAHLPLVNLASHSHQSRIFVNRACAADGAEASSAGAASAKLNGYARVFACDGDEHRRRMGGAKA